MKLIHLIEARQNYLFNVISVFIYDFNKLMTLKYLFHTLFFFVIWHY